MSEADNELILEYLRGEGYVEEVAQRLLAKVTKYPEIGKEFVHWLETRKYDAERPIAVAGWTAAVVVEAAPDLDGIGAYNFLVDLQDYPEEAKKVIEEGFGTL